MIKATLGDRLDGWIHRLLPFLFRRRIDPNLLTVLGVLVSLGAAFAFAEGAFLAGALLMLAGGFFDLVDGVMARHHGIATPFGAFLDSTLDRLVDMAILLGILVHYARVGEIGVVVLAGVGLVASVLVSYAKARAERYVAHFEGGIFERGERIGVLAAGGVFGVMVPALWIVAVGSALTVLQRFAQAHREMDRMPAPAGEAGGPP